MCKVGDLILVDHYKHGENTVSRHTFVVVNDDNGEIRGLSYDFIANALSSFKSPEQKERKMGYPGNFPLVASDMVMNPNNGKSAYVKTDQLYYFNKSTLNYVVIGHIDQDIMDLIFEFIKESVENGDFEFEEITDNLEP